MAPDRSCEQTTPLVALRDIEVVVPKPSPIRILHPLSLDISAATSIAIVGPSGAGKTTLASLIGALLQPTHGSYRFAGDEIVGMSRSKLAGFRAREVGFVFQNSHLINERNVLDNIELGLVGSTQRRSQRREMCAAAADWVGLSPIAARRSSLLSGGERHRVAIARALVKAPRLIIADEPTAALDQETGRTILDLLVSAKARGTTVVLVTHDPRAADLVDFVHQIVDGHLLTDVPA